MNRTIIALLATVLLASAVPATAKVPEQLQLVGSGKARWLTFTLYQAELYSPTGSFVSIDQASYPLALSITYQRNIAGHRLVDATEQEWQRLLVAHRQEWVSQLNALWPDVGPDDNLTFIAHSADRGEFFFNRQPLGTITGETFAEAFLTIWLSPETRDSRLRAALIGT